MEHFIVVVLGNSMLAYICSNYTYTDSMYTSIIVLFIVLGVLLELVCLKMDNEKV